MNLINIIFETTTDCNYNCLYCYNIWKINKDRNYRINSYKQSKNTLKKLLENNKIETITFTGGEPFVSERFNELMMYVRLKGVNINVITNGSMLNSETIGYLKKLSVGAVEIPFLSINPEIHDKLVCHEGAWNSASESIRLLIKNDIFIVTVIVLTKYNVATISETIEYLATAGVRNIMVNRFNIGGMGIRNAGDLVVPYDDLQKAYSSINILAERYNLEVTSSVCTPYCILNPEEYKNIYFPRCTASVTDKPITVDAVGNVRICNHSPIVLGNIFNNSLESILNNDLAKKWTSVIPDFCTDCSFVSDCNGGCRGASEQLGLSIKNEDPILKLMN